MSNAGEPFRRGWGNPSNQEGHISVEDVRHRAYRSNFGLYQLTRLFVDTCRRQNPRRRRLCHLAMQLWMEKLYAKGFERFRSLRWYPPQLQRVRADLEARIDSLVPVRLLQVTHRRRLRGGTDGGRRAADHRRSRWSRPSSNSLHLTR